MNYLHLVLTSLTGLLLFLGSVAMPNTGDPMSAPAVHVSPRYIEDSLEEPSVPNMVTAVLADYRGFDTLGETAVIFTGAMAVLLILRTRREEQ